MKLKLRRLCNRTATAVCVAAIFALAACGGSDTTTTSTPTKPVATQQPIQEGVMVLSGAAGRIVVGQPYIYTLSAKPVDKRNRITSYAVSNPTVGGAKPTISPEGKIQWTPNAADMAADALKITITTATGKPVKRDLPVSVSQERVVINTPIDPAQRFYSDGDGVYIVEVAVKSGVTNPGKLLLKAYRDRSNRENYDIQVDVDKAVARLIDYPKAKLGFQAAIQTQATVLPRGTKAEPAPGLHNIQNEFTEYGVQAVGTLLEPKSVKSWNFYTTRNDVQDGAFYYLPTNIERERQVIQIDSNCTLPTGNPADKSVPDLCKGKKAPIIFIHGFLPDAPVVGGMNGGKSTWNQAASIAINNGHDVFEFRWMTHMRFEEAAGQLANLINSVARQTGLKPIIIAHSFGGIVSHLALSNQGVDWKNDNWEAVRIGVGLEKASDVAEKLLTLGAPVGGIYDGVTGKTLAGMEWGRDFEDVSINGCQSITCIQAGATDVDNADILLTFTSPINISARPVSIYEYMNYAFNSYIKDKAQTGNLVYISSPAQESNSIYYAQAIAKIGKIRTGVSEIDRTPTVKHDVPTIALVGIKSGAIRPSDYDGPYTADTHLGDGLVSVKGQMFPEDVVAAGARSFKLNKEQMSWINEMPIGKPMIYANRNVKYLFFNGIKHSSAQGSAPFDSEAGAWSGSKMVINWFACIPGKGWTSCAPRTESLSHPLADLIISFNEANRYGYNASLDVHCTIKGSTVVNSNGSMALQAGDIIPYTADLFDAQTGRRVGRSYDYGRKTGEDGKFSVDLSSLIDMKASNFDRANLYAKLTFGDNVNYEITPVMVQNLNADEVIVPDVRINKLSNRPGMVNFSGKVIDGQTQGTPIDGAAVKLRMGRNLSAYDLFWATNSNTSRVVYTDANGVFNVSQIRPGIYSALVTKRGYVQEIQGQLTVTANGTISLSLLKVLGASEGSITLRWDTGAGGSGVSSDLDSHLLRFSAGTALDYHIYYNSSQGSDGDNLDRDDTDFEGPETITFTPKTGKNYAYYVHNYTGGNTTIPKSSPLVILRLGSRSYRFDLPVTQSNQARYWRVFDIVNGQVRPCTNRCLQDAQPAAITTQSDSYSPLPDDVLVHLDKLPAKH